MWCCYRWNKYNIAYFGYCKYYSLFMGKWWENRDICSSTANFNEFYRNDSCYYFDYFNCKPDYSR